MQRTLFLLGAALLALITPLITSGPPVHANVQPGTLQQSEHNSSPWVANANVDPAVKYRGLNPSTVYHANGSRVEIYSSIGNIEGASGDWGLINSYSRLVASVPARSQLYSTVFNSLWDGDKVRYDANQQKWVLTSSGKVFSPLAAFLKQVNQYDNADDRTRYIHVLGSRSKIDKANSQGSGLANLLKHGVSTSQNRPLDYRYCTKGSGSCLSSITSGSNLMHAKYAAFEKAEDSDGTLRDHVVWITSANLNGSSGGKKSNVSIAIYDDKRAYDGVVETVYSSQVNQRMNNAFRAALQPTNGAMTGIATDSGVTLYPSPRAATLIASPPRNQAVDVEAQFLRAQASNGVTNKHGCKLYAVHSLFNSARGAIVDQLAALQRQRCDVRVVLGENALKDVVDAYFAMSTSLRTVIDRVEFANVHDKTLSYQHGSTAATFGGSSNFNGTSLNFDELAFRADGVEAANGVQAHSQRVYERARGQTTWTKPSSVSLRPASSSTNRLTVRRGDALQLSTRIAPNNELVTNTLWQSSNPEIATVGPTGIVRGLAPGIARIEAVAESPNSSPDKKATAYIQVSEDGKTSAGAGPVAIAPPVLSMDRYQTPSPGGKTTVTVTWGSGKTDYDGVVKLQYYSGGKWKTYCGSNPNCWVNIRNGTGRKTFSFKSSHTWRAFGARLDAIDGRTPPAGSSTAKTRSTGLVIHTVRTKKSATKPRLYATNMAKSGQQVPMLFSWRNPYAKRGYPSTVRLQRKSGKKWVTHKTFQIANGSVQILLSTPIIKTHTWRIASGTNAVPKGKKARVSNTRKIVMRK